MGDNPKGTAVLIIHGFGGGVDEVAYLRDYLARQGMPAYCVKLAGHDGTRGGLARSTYADWVASAVRAYNRLCRRYERVLLAGFSMGALIGAYLARGKKAAALVMINTPVYFWNLPVIAADVWQDLRDHTSGNLAYYGRSVARVSPKSGVDFLLLRGAARKQLERVEIPTLVLQCRRDESVRPRSALYISRRIGGARLKIYEGGRHQIFRLPGDLRETVCRDIATFLHTHATGVRVHGAGIV